MTETEQPDSRAIPSETGPETRAASPASASISRQGETPPPEAGPAKDDRPPPSKGGPKPEERPADDPDAPLNIPWKRVVLFLILAWAFFRFSWLIFEAAG